MRVSYAWRYLALAVGPCQGQLGWTWRKGLDADSLQETLAQDREEVQLEVVIWDRAPGHRARRLEGE